MIAVTLPHRVPSFLYTKYRFMEKRTSVHLGKVPLYRQKMALLFCTVKKIKASVFRGHSTDKTEIPIVEFNWTFSYDGVL